MSRVGLNGRRNQLAPSHSEPKIINCAVLCSDRCFLYGPPLRIVEFNISPAKEHWQSALEDLSSARVVLALASAAGLD